MVISPELHDAICRRGLRSILMSFLAVSGRHSGRLPDVQLGFRFPLLIKTILRVLNRLKKLQFYKSITSVGVPLCPKTFLLSIEVGASLESIYECGANRFQKYELLTPFPAELFILMNC